MKREKKVKFLKGLLNVIGVTILILLYTAVNTSIINLDEKGIIKTVLSLTLGIIFLGAYLIIIFDLKKVLNLVLGKNPFVQESITRFRRIGYCIFSIGLIDAIARYPDGGKTGFTLIGTSNGSIKPIFFLYLVIGILAFILADVFKMAIDIKDENDLTI